MHYLVDGHNLIAQLSDIELGDPNDEVKLVLMLRSWTSAGRNRNVTVYFDGGVPGGKARELSQGNVQVIFAPSDRPADDLLIHHIRRAQIPGSYTLVSADHQIVGWAKRRHMPVLTSEAFARRMEREQQARRVASRPDEGSEPEITAGEVDEWLALFGPSPETGPPPMPARHTSHKEKPKIEKPPQKARHASELKTSGDLTEEEIATWLELFGPSSDE